MDATTVLVSSPTRADINLDGLICTDDAAILGNYYDENQPAFRVIGNITSMVFTPDDAAIFGTFYDESLPPVGQVCAPLHAGDPAGIHRS